MSCQKLNVLTVKVEQVGLEYLSFRIHRDNPKRFLLCTSTKDDIVSLP